MASGWLNLLKPHQGGHAEIKVSRREANPAPRTSAFWVRCPCTKQNDTRFSFSGALFKGEGGVGGEDGKMGLKADAGAVSEVEGVVDVTGKLLHQLLPLGF